ncbi:patatin-like phospholipase family protein [Azoarcus sp. PA01]|nr:patatin-like phospholipase family protein [Azoarcus sp. PA01]
MEKSKAEKPDAEKPAPIPVSLILSGGLALGAYQAGVLEAFDESGLVETVAVAGSSIGALNGALFVGNPADRRTAQLRAFWARITSNVLPGKWLQPGGLADPRLFRHARNWINTLGAHVAGVPNLFRLRTFLDAGPSEVPSFYDSSRTRVTLAEMVDFDRLNDGPVRYCAVATDVETSAAVPFDTAHGARITIDHLLASSSLLPSFPPVRIGTRLLADGGLCANAPLEPFLASDRVGKLPSLCILIDLFSPEAKPPRTLEAAMERGTDIKFAAQTRLRLEAIERERRLEAAFEPTEADERGTDLIHLCYRPLPHDAGSEKQYDFSSETLADRWQYGRADGRLALERIRALAQETGQGAGLRVHRIGAWTTP